MSGPFVSTVNPHLLMYSNDTAVTPLDFKCTFFCLPLSQLLFTLCIHRQFSTDEKDYWKIYCIDVELFGFLFEYPALPLALPFAGLSAPLPIMSVPLIYGRPLYRKKKPDRLFKQRIWMTWSPVIIVKYK